MSADQPAVLREAYTIVAEQLARLRTLAESTRQSGAALGAALRQSERQLDEALMQQRAASQSRAIVGRSLTQKVAELRARHEATERDLQASQHALKQLEQIIRQIEMSSASLTNAEESNASDPWVLALRAQIIHGREEERTRLAREVHDGPAQVLANSLMLIESGHTLAQQAGIAKLELILSRMRDATREGMREVRRFIADLRPGALDDQVADGLHGGALFQRLRRRRCACAKWMGSEAGSTTAGSSWSPTSSHSTTVSTPSVVRQVCVTGK